MDAEEVAKLPVGIYRLHWQAGGCSLAAVGMDAAGRHWYAPANWVRVPSYDWGRVEVAEVVERAFPDCLG